MTFHAEAEGSTILLRACNPTANPIDPDGAGGATYAYIVFD